MMEGLKEALQYIAGLKAESMEPKVVEIGGKTYCNKDMRRYHSFDMADEIRANTLTAIVNEFQFDHYYDQERFLIELQSNFIPTEDLESIMKVAGNIKAGTTANYDDDGISQKTTIKSGIANNTDVIVPNPVRLMPYRTFGEIRQPESAYVFRIKDSERGPAFKLVEADGGLWKNAAMKQIKEYLEQELSEELKEYHITVIA